MANITMYTTAYCPYCNNAERLLQSKGVTEKTGRRTVPQIYIDERHVGGFDDLRALDLAGELEPLLAGCA